MAHRERMIGVLVTAWLGLAMWTPVGASERKPGEGAENYDAWFARYLDMARAQSSTPAPSPWLTSLVTDVRARSVNDIVTIRVEESIAGTGSADSSLAKSGKGSASVPSFFGLETKLPSLIDPTNLAALSRDTKFNGTGTTSRTGALTAVLTARVAEVLPSGDLVLEGIREIEINGDRQIVVLTGVARQADIAPGNVLSSASIAQLRIRYFGKGLMKDSLTPGWLIRVLNKLF